MSLPARYQQPWSEDFWQFVHQVWFPGAAILDVGPGRQPTIPPAQRPADTYYVGLDVSAAELEAAPAGSYDEAVVGNAQTLAPPLVGRFDLIVSWLALEHVRRLDRAAAAFHAYAKPGGWFIAHLSGRYAAFAIANRILPAPVGARVVARLRRRPLQSVFPAHYDHCTEGGLREAFAAWEEVSVVPLWHGADYLERLPLLQRYYLRYESWTMERGLSNLSTHYVVAARKSGGR